MTKKFVHIKVINENNDYFDNKEAFDKIDKFFLESTAFFIYLYQDMDYLFFCDNDASLHMLAKFVYLKTHLLRNLKLNVIFKKDFNISSLTNNQKRLYNYVKVLINKIDLPDKFTNKPYEYINKISSFVAAVDISNGNMFRYREK